MVELLRPMLERWLFVALVEQSSQRKMRSWVIFMSGGSTLNALSIFFVTDNLHLPAAFYTTLTSAAGIGAIIGAAVGSIVVKRLKLPQVLSYSLIGWGLLVLLFAHLTIFVPVLVIFFFLGGLNAGVNIAVGPLLIKNTPKPLIGRAVAILTPAVTAASMLSTVIAGTLASTLKNLHGQLLAIQYGPIDTIFTVTGLLAILAGLYAHTSFTGQRQSVATPADDCS
jgi:predicted MFS family arabinose efflux permease